MMGSAVSLGTAAIEIASKTAAMGVGGAVGAAIVFGVAKCIGWLKSRAT